MKQHFLLFLAAVIIISSCSKDEISIIDKPIVETNSAESSSSSTCTFDIQEGQIEKYLFFMGGNYYIEDSVNMCRTGDTLVLEVLEKLDSTSYSIREFFAPGSKIFTADDPNYYWGEHEDTLYHTWLFRNDSLIIITPESTWWQTAHLTYFETGISLDKPNEISCVFNKWRPDPLFNADHTNNYIVNSQEYPQLDVHVNNWPMAADGNGMTMTYGKQHGIVTTFTASAWTGDVQGWLKL